jgi:hypothetical protein
MIYQTTAWCRARRRLRARRGDGVWGQGVATTVSGRGSGGDGAQRRCRGDGRARERERGTGGHDRGKGRARPRRAGRRGAQAGTTAARGGRGEGRADGAAAGRRRGRGERRRGDREWEERRRRKEKAGRFISLLCRVPAIWHSANIFKILKYSLPSTRSRALGKDGFAECQLTGTRQRSILGFLSSANGMALGKEDSLPSVNRLTLDKALFTECHLWTLGKVHFYFF